MAKVILDTNIYISSFLFGGNARTVFDYCFLYQEVIISDFIIDEIKKTLTGKFKLNSTQQDSLVGLLLTQAKKIEPLGEKPDICRDSDDNNILWLAQYSQAEFLITGDKNLLIITEFTKTKIIHPKDYLTEINPY